ncbi:HU family DNA-binding protein [Hydrogenobaculum acidophilum]
MTKKEMASMLAEKVNIPVSKAELVVSVFTDILSKAILKDGYVNLYGFGTFKVSTRKARKGRNPKTGEVIDIPDQKTVRFRLNSSLKEQLNQKKK